MNNSELGAYFSDELTFEEVEKKISENPVMIIPIGGLEPIGNRIPLGIINKITIHIAEKVALKNQCLCAPLLTYGYTTPFSSFEGAFAVKRNIMESMLRELVRDSLQWGIKKVLFINITTIPADFFPGFVKKLKFRNFESKSISFFDLQNNSDIRKDLLGNKKSDIRLEKALISLALSLKLITKDAIADDVTENAKDYSKWRRRGRDPQLLKKKFPSGQIDPLLINCTAEEGNILLNKITDSCCNLISEEDIN